jgi:hypothetical protein
LLQVVSSDSSPIKSFDVSIHDESDATLGLKEGLKAKEEAFDKIKTAQERELGVAADILEKVTPLVLQQNQDKTYDNLQKVLQLAKELRGQDNLEKLLESQESLDRLRVVGLRVVGSGLVF